MFLSGIGFKCLQSIQFTRGKEFLHLLQMKLLFRLVVNTSGYGFVSSQFIVLCLESISQNREICLLLKNSFDLQLINMENIQFTQMVERYPEACTILGLKHYLHSSIEKILMERVNQYFKDRTELFDDYYSCIKNECNLFHVHN